MAHESFLLWVRRHPFLLTIALLVFLDSVLICNLLVREHPVLRVSFLDVGQGDAVLIEAPNGNQLLYDAGPPSGASLRALSREMSFLDRSIDVVVFSHPDVDHIGGFPEIFKRYRVGAVIEPHVSSGTGVYDATEEAIRNEHCAHFVAKRGTQVELGDGVVLDILYPDVDHAGADTNSASVVMLLHYGATAFLLSGDLPQKEEEQIAREFGGRLHAQVLKLGHHGSRTSSSPYWLAAVDPDVAIISAGLDNRYGHPHKEVLELLERLGIPYLSTFKEGTVSYESDGETVTRD